MLLFEVWEDVVGYEGLYKVSDRGRVESLHKYRGTQNRMKKLSTDDQGYLCVILNKNKKSKVRRVHTLVLVAFRGLPPTEHQACHSDGNRLNSVLTNLRWGTSRENSEDSIRHNTMPRGEQCGRSKLTESQVVEIKLLRRQGISQYVVADRFGVHQATISLIDRRKTWSHIK